MIGFSILKLLLDRLKPGLSLLASLKLKFLYFLAATDPHSWLFQIERVFLYTNTPDDYRLPIAYFCMAGPALQWFHWLYYTHQITTWEAFTRDLELQFGPSFQNPEVTLYKLRQSTSVSAYMAEFETIAIRTTGLTHLNLLNCFISGLKEDIQCELLFLKPKTLSEAIGMAKLVEDKLNSVRTFSFRAQPPVPAMPRPSNPPPNSSSLPVRRMSVGEMAARRDRGLCCKNDKKISPMVDKLRPTTFAVYFYVPNIISYLRILMNCLAFTICFKYKYHFSFLYFLSFACDALDGWFAHKLNQVSTFGAVLDMIADRMSTAYLLVNLSQIYRPGFIFLSLIALDIASHWLQMYSSFLMGKSSHKDVKDSCSWLFKLYYGNQKFMCYCCVSCEVLYIVLFLLAKNQTENLTEVLANGATLSWLYLTLLSACLLGWVIKQIVNVIQMKTAADACILYDIGKEHMD